jgi:hypothetical protein
MKFSHWGLMRLAGPRAELRLAGGDGAGLRRPQTAGGRVWLAAILAAAGAALGTDPAWAASIVVPDYSFESPPTSFAGPDIDSWQKTPQPAWWVDTVVTNSAGGTNSFTWADLTGEFLNTPVGAPDHIDNCDGAQALFLFADPQVGVFQDYDSTDWTNSLPTHAFDATFEAGRSYLLVVGVIGGGGGMTNGASLELGLYYRDAASNQVVVAATNIVNSSALFPNTTNFIDFSAQLPTVQAGDAWAGQHIGILLLSTVSFGGYGGGGYWDLDNVRLISASAPVLSDCTVTNGRFAFTLQSDPGAACEVLAAANLSLPASQWTSLGTVTNLTGSMVFVDNTALVGSTSNAGRRFYLARLVD